MVRKRTVPSHRRLSAAEQSAFERLYVLLEQRLLPRLPCRLPGALEAGDLLHDTVLIVASHGDKLAESDDCLAAYGWKVAMSLICKETAAQARLQRSATERCKVSYCDPALEAPEHREWLESRRRCLKSKEVKLFELLLVNGLEDEQARLELDLSATTYRKRKERLFQRLRKAEAPMPPSASPGRS